MKSLYEDLIKVDLKALNEALEGFTTKTQELLPKIPNRASGSQIRAMLRNAGVTDDEIRYLKLGPVLDKDMVTKQEIIGHLEQRGLPFTENDPTKNYGPKYKQYALSGGKNYGEKIIHFNIDRKKIEYNWIQVPEDKLDAADVVAEWRMYHPKDTPGRSQRMSDGLAQVYIQKDDGGSGGKNVIGRVHNDDESTREWKTWKVVYQRTPQEDRFDAALEEAKTACEAHVRKAWNPVDDYDEDGFKSSHWAGANQLFHVRHQEFTDADGKHLWLIEEIQSDWHQSGRKKGYNGSIKAEIRHVPAEGETHPYHVYMGNEKISGHKDEASAKTSAADIEKRWVGGVADAPMKKSWEENAFKYALQQAVKAGAERIGWVTGGISADRYDLSKQIGSVYYNEDDEELRAYYPSESRRAFNGGLAFEKTQVKPDDLPNYIGKDAAEKLMAAPRASRGGRTIGGLDLKVGGEGMKAAYDQRIPSIAKKIAKAGGSQVGKVKLGGASTNPKGRRTVPPVTVGQMRKAANVIRDSKSGIESNENWADKEEAKKFDDKVEDLCAALEDGGRLPEIADNLSDMNDIESWDLGETPASDKALQIVLSAFGWDGAFDDDSEISDVFFVMRNYDDHVQEEDGGIEVWYMDITDGIKELVNKGLRLTFESVAKKDWWVI